MFSCIQVPNVNMITLKASTHKLFFAGLALDLVLELVYSSNESADSITPIILFKQ